MTTSDYIVLAFANKDIYPDKYGAARCFLEARERLTDEDINMIHIVHTFSIPAYRCDWINNLLIGG